MIGKFKIGRSFRHPLSMTRRSDTNQAGPDSIDDLFAWYSKTDVYQDADMEIPATAQLDPVRAMPDLSGNERHMIWNAPLMAQAFLQKEIFTADQAVYFDGVLGLLLADWDGLERDSLTLVLRVIPCSPHYGFFAVFNGGPNDGLGIDNAFNTGAPIYGYQNNTGRFFPPVLINTGSVTLTYRIFPNGSDTPGAELRINGSATVQSYTPTAGTTTLPGIMGSDRYQFGPVESRPIQCYIQDLALYSRPITDDEVEVVEGAFSGRPVPTSRFPITKSLLIFDGNSIPASIGGATYPGLTARNEINAHVVNTAASALRSPVLTSTFATRVTPYYNASRTLHGYIVFEMTNDFVGNLATAAEAYTNIKALAQSAIDAGFQKVAIMTCLPAATITSAGRETARQDANDMLRADFTTSTGITRVTATDGSFNYILIDIGNHPDFGQPGDEANATNYPDGTHPSAGVHAIIEEDSIRPVLDLWGFFYDAPTGLAVSSTTALVTWDAIPGVIFYRLRRSIAGAGVWTTIANIRNNSYQDYMPSTASYDYQVAAGQVSDYSSSVTVAYTRVVSGAVSLLRDNTRGLSVANHADFNTATSFTCAGWVRINSGTQTNDNHPIFSKFTWFSAASESVRGWTCFINGGNLTIWSNILDATGTQRIVASPALVEDTWYYVEVYWDANNLLWGLRINNGDYYDGTVSVAAGVLNNLEAFRVGREREFPCIDGSIATVRFWSRLLTAAERKLNYNALEFDRGNPIHYADLPVGIKVGMSASYDFISNGTLVNDSTANAHTLTNVNGVTHSNYPF